MRAQPRLASPPLRFLATALGCLFAVGGASAAEITLKAAVFVPPTTT